MARSFYRTYRPRTFSEVVGQQHVVTTLENALSEGRPSHSYLFTGPRGTGKTSMARLLAKALLCERGLSATPDGTCDACERVADGTHPDVYELDAASRTGVDNVREEIINRVAFAPTQGSYKVYIIDEVHMLTTAAFNALLKTLEEPPSHVIFVLCTTDPHKVPETIMSRCQRFDFHRIADEDIAQRLAFVCEQENLTAEPNALELIARHSQGGMRDALSMLEQLAVFGDGTITVDDTRSVLGEVETAALSEIAQRIAAHDVVGCYQWIADFSERGVDLLQFVNNLTSYVRDLYVVSITGPTKGVLNASEAHLAHLSEEAKLFSGPDQLNYILVTLGDAARDLRTATDQRLTVELAFARVARPQAELSLESLATRIEALESMPARTSAPAATAAPAPTTPPAPVPAAKPAPTPALAPEPAPTPTPASAPTEVTEPSVPQQTAPAEKTQAVAPEEDDASLTDVSVIDQGTLNRKWNQVIDHVMKVRPARGVLLKDSHVSQGNQSSLSVELPAGADFSRRMLERPECVELVKEATQAVFGHPVRVTYCTGFACTAQESPAAQEPAVQAPASVQAPAEVQEPVAVQAPPVQAPVAAVTPDPTPTPPPVEVPLPTPQPEPEPEPAQVPEPEPSEVPEPEPAVVPEPTVVPEPEPEMQAVDDAYYDSMASESEKSDDPILNLLSASFGEGIVLHDVTNPEE